MVQIYAHRGSSGTHPENTLPAFAEAVRVGSDGIELDVHLSADGQIVVMHDEEVDRTTNGKGLLREKTLEEIKKLNAGSWFSKDFSAAKVPTLKEVLNLLLQKNYRGVLMIELKTDKYEYPQIEEKVSALLQQSWPFEHGYCSFNLASLERMAKLEPDVQLDVLTGTSKNKIMYAKENKFIEGVHPKKTWLQEQPEQSGIFDKPIRPWTINTEEEINWCYGLGVTGIITDYPERAIRLKQFMKK